jgi:hypothetical protein
MPFAAQLDLDAGTEATLCALAGQLAAIPGLETVHQIGDVHHLSLGVYDELPLDRFLPKLTSFAATLTPMDVRLATLGSFPGVRSILFIGPVVTVELLDLHRRFHHEFAAFASSCWNHSRPGAGCLKSRWRWTPHPRRFGREWQTALNGGSRHKPGWTLSG